MKSYELLDAVGGIEPRHIEAAERETKQNKRKRGWIGPLAAAACVGLAVMIAIPILTKKNADAVMVGGIAREYKDAAVVGEEVAVEWPWEYKTVCERYPAVRFEGREYTLKSSGRGLREETIGEKLGVAEGVGYDGYTDREYRQDFDVYEIKGISCERMIAALMDGQFYPFKYSAYVPPETFGEVLDDYSLSRFLTLGTCTVYDDGQNGGTYSLSDDGFIWQTLEGCRDARFVEDEGGGRISRDRITFSVTSDVLGVYKRAFYVSADGYVGTNIFDWAYTFFIGEEAAASILAYAEKNGVEAQPEPYLYSLAGTLTEIGDGYILVDDSILCKDEKDGMVFKVLTADIRVSRCIDFLKIGVGSLVVVSFTEPVGMETENGYTISSATGVTRGTFSGGEVLVPE